MVAFGISGFFGVSMEWLGVSEDLDENDDESLASIRKIFSKLIKLFFFFQLNFILIMFTFL